MYKEGKAFEEKHYLDAWDNVAYLQTPEVDDAVGSNGGSYSEKAYVYTDNEGAEQKCVLLYMSNNDDAYTLVEENVKTKKTAKGELQTGITNSVKEEVRESCSLPAYEYKGDDPVMKAICEDMADDEEVEEGEVLIPEPNIYGKAEEGDGYTESINRFTEGYPAIRSKFMASACRLLIMKSISSEVLFC